MLAHHQPIFIAAPAQRCGTTLVQRLLCSTSNTLIFGESVANDLSLLAGVYQSKQMVLGSSSPQWRQAQLDSVLAGQVNAWIPDLLPDTEAYLDHFLALIEENLSFYQNYVQERGRTYWGCKLPAWPVAQLALLTQLIPESKVIYISRDLEDCVVSARTINLCLDEPSTQHFRQMYTYLSQEAQRQLPPERTFWIKYEELVADPAPILMQLEQFTGAQDMDHQVMTHRVGNYEQLKI